MTTATFTGTTVVRDAFDRLRRLWLRAVDEPLAWQGQPGAAWDRIWDAFEMAEAVERSARRAKELTGCVYAPARCADDSPMNCQSCRPGFDAQGRQL